MDFLSTKHALLFYINVTTLVINKPGLQPGFSIRLLIVIYRIPRGPRRHKSSAIIVVLKEIRSTELSQIGWIEVNEAEKIYKIYHYDFLEIKSIKNYALKKHFFSLDPNFLPAGIV